MDGWISDVEHISDAALYTELWKTKYDTTTSQIEASSAPPDAVK